MLKIWNGAWFRLGERAKEAIIIVEGIYSMLGDVAPLAEIVDIKRRLGGYLIVDEAHSFGVLGATGRGLAEAVGVEDDVDIIVGTFSKSLASIGGLLRFGSDGSAALRQPPVYFYRLSFSVLHCDRALIVKNHCHTTRAAAKADG